MVQFNVCVDVDVDLEWCDIWDKVKDKMIPDILDRIYKEYSSEFEKWLLEKNSLFLEKSIITENNVNRFKQQQQAHQLKYRKLI